MPADPKFSHRSLPQKLGIKSGMRVLIVNEPEADTIPRADMPDNVTLATRAAGSIDMVLLFALDTKQLTVKLDSLIGLLPKDGTLWTCWPKKASKLATDIDRDVVFRLLHPTGLVDVKVCSVDETWSALKWVYRVKDR
jgi:hypothetical protein